MYWRNNASLFSSSSPAAAPAHQQKHQACCSCSHSAFTHTLRKYMRPTCKQDGNGHLVTGSHLAKGFSIKLGQHFIQHFCVSESHAAVDAKLRLLEN